MLVEEISSSRLLREPVGEWRGTGSGGAVAPEELVDLRPALFIFEGCGGFIRRGRGQRAAV